jgi:hypothetical protein
METTKTFSELREIAELATKLGIDSHDLLAGLIEETSFEIDNYRFINSHVIDGLMVEEMESDPYILGCFNDWFIAENTDLSLDIVQALQAGEKFEAIGQHIIDNGFTEQMAEEYARLDGYGHHFAHYDSETNEFLDWYYFRTN